MRPNIKIATCCYCGSRTMLKPTARTGHELACGNCGAPLHEMKWLKAPKPSQPKVDRPANTYSRNKNQKLRKRKQRKPLWRRALEDAWDEIEDIFD
jgi:hypothetical protein